MKITNIRMEKVEQSPRVLAKYNVTFDNEFAVHNIRLIKGVNRNFISFPSKENKDGLYMDICHPISSDFRKYLEEELIKYYEEN